MEYSEKKGLKYKLKSSEEVYFAVPFAYGPFEKQANALFLALQGPTDSPAPPKLTPSAPQSLARDEFVWQVHSYLDLLGLCHYCKKHSCPGPLNRAHINIPTTFQALPNLSDYSAPQAWSGSITTPGRPTQAPAGCPPARAATVAAIADTTPLEAQVAGLTVDAAIREDAHWDSYFDNKGCFPNLDPAAVAALAELDNQLLTNEIERAKQANLADAIAGH
ncbi:hypothetical protein PCANC_23032 [Puccinia coronata f. sp. avenae]|uniref:Uncharacterized protein n=1 Tax=Puccinia coronata f. sp. avenae TaxID=200324 RepID=A0A2N5TT28_9BASI|nr:hypothetical protein PCANC_23032 [Puccinia coronata f. sp. avenae]